MTYPYFPKTITLLFIYHSVRLSQFKFKRLEHRSPQPEILAALQALIHQAGYDVRQTLEEWHGGISLNHLAHHQRRAVPGTGKSTVAHLPWVQLFIVCGISGSCAGPSPPPGVVYSQL